MSGVAKKRAIAHANGTVKLSNALIGPTVNASATVPTKAPSRLRPNTDTRFADTSPVYDAREYAASAPRKAKMNIIVDPSSDLSENE